MVEITVKVHDVTTDGLPDMDDAAMSGRVAFIWDGAVISGWPQRPGPGLTYDDPLQAQWNGAEDRFHGPFAGVRYWLELPVPAWSIGRGQHVEQGIELTATQARNRVDELEAAMFAIARVTNPGDIRTLAGRVAWETLTPARKIAREALGLPLGGQVMIDGRWVDADV